MSTEHPVMVDKADLRELIRFAEKHGDEYPVDADAVAHVRAILDRVPVPAGSPEWMNIMHGKGSTRPTFES